MRRLFLIVALASICAACSVNQIATTVPAPSPTPSPAPAQTAVPQSVPELAPYRAAMKPEFAAEVDQFGAVPRYQIDLTIAPDHQSYTATQQVRYTNLETETLKEIYFMLFPNLPPYRGSLKVESVTANGEAITPQLKPGRVAMKVDLPQPLSPGETIELALTYSGRIPVLSAATGYNQFGLHDNILTLPNFYPQIPAYDDEGWNITPGPTYGDTVFSDTALYQVNITAPAGDVVAASGSCTTNPGEQTQTLHCVSGPMRDFMIAASPEFEVWSDVVDGVKINSYARKSLATGGERALKVAKEAVQSYDKRFGAYPFAELDVVGTPTTAGGIEYPGLVVIAENIYERGGPLVDGVVAHEVGHQWWYSLVGNDQIDEPWIDEALAQFATALYFRDWYGGQRGMDVLLQSWQSGYDQVIGKPDNKRADLPVGKYSESQYNVIVYEKAPLFFNALYEALGDEQFNQFLQEYFQTYRYKVAYPKDLIAIAVKHAGQAKVDELLKEWITTP